MNEDLPIGWVKTELGEITQIHMGQSPSGKTTNEDGIGLPLVGGASDFKGDTIKPSRFTSIPTKICDPDDLILCIRATIGKLAFAKEPYCLGRGVAGIRPCKGINRNWLKYYLVSDAQKLDASGTGSTFRQIDKSTLVAWKILLPPLNEQRRIVEKLDRIFDRLRRVRDELSHIKKLIDRYRQAVLTAAFSGDLTADWRDKNNISFNWKKVKITDIGYLGRGKSKHRPRNDPRLYGGVYPFIQTGDIAQSNGIIENHSQTYSEFGLSQSKLWQAGTVCITIAANIGYTAILAYPACFPDSVVGFVCDDKKCLPKFFKWSIDIISEDLKSFAPATAQKNVNLKILKDIELFCPPLEEQREIVQRIEERFFKIDKLEQEYQKAMKLCDRLEQETLAKAFRGELVPQDPNDEPASVLLERIRAEQQSKTKAKTAKSKKRSGKK